MLATDPRIKEARRDPRPKRELGLHIFVAELLHFNGVKGLIAYHVPNGEVRSKRTAARLKLMGVKAGVPDFALVLAGGRSAFLEIKTDKGRTSPEQRAFAALCADTGALFSIARSPEEAQAILLEWGAILNVERRAA